MLNNKWVLVIFSIIFGLITAISSVLVGGFLFLPGLFFGIGIYLMHKILFGVKVKSKDITRVIIGCALTYLLVFIFVYFSTFTRGIEEGASLLDYVVAGFIGGIGTCYSYAFLNYKFRTENIMLVIISILASILFSNEIGDKVSSSLVIPFLAWQGAMMGALAFFTLRKMEKQRAPTEPAIIA